MPRTERPEFNRAQLTIYRYIQNGRERAFNGIGMDNPRAIDARMSLASAANCAVPCWPDVSLERCENSPLPR